MLYRQLIARHQPESCIRNNYKGLVTACLLQNLLHDRRKALVHKCALEAKLFVLCSPLPCIVHPVH